MPARKHTPYYHKFIELGAEIVDRIGFDTAARFTTIEDEHRATREAAGLYDVYYQGPLDLKGPDAAALLQRLLVNDIERIGDGGVLYSSMCNEQGGMLDDMTVYRLSPEHYWIVSTPSRAALIEQWVTEHARGLHAYVTNCVSGTAYISLQGPKSRDILGRLTDADLSTGALPYFSFTQTDVAEVPTLLSRTGYSGELGYELYYPRDYAEHIWDSLLAAGSEDGLKPCGLGALRSVRMEKKYPLYGLDLTEGNSPYEAGLGWTVRLKAGEFIGRDALARQNEQGVERQLVGIELAGIDFLPVPGDAIVHDGDVVGHVTSSDRGFHLGVSLLMGYVATGIAVPDMRVNITSTATGEDYAGVVHTRAFYDPEMSRVKV
ncbi:MAG: glycine cleavage system aminomethyltransferase GcvT [Thermomicrobiales bacterium]